jgi:hypothetical protein
MATLMTPESNMAQGYAQSGKSVDVTRRRCREIESPWGLGKESGKPRRNRHGWVPKAHHDRMARERSTPIEEVKSWATW